LGGGNLISILATELREKRGLTYGVYSQFSHLTGLGPFMISFSTEQTQARSAENLTRKLLEQFIQTGPSAAELKAAKKYLTGSFPLSIASNQNMAHILLSMLFYGLPDNYLETYVQSIQAVTAQQIQKAFKTHINPARLLSVTVGKT
jgi:zinc protease